jgi:hypothetical protein
MTTVPMRGIKTIDITKNRRRRKGYLKESEITYGEAAVIALDPGGTTGWSLITVHPEALTEPNADLFENIFDHQHGQVDCGTHRGNLATSLHEGISTEGEFSGIYDLVELIKAWPSAAVVIEDFTLRQMRMDRELLSPVRITSAVGHAMWLEGRDYHVQSAGDAKNICSDERLREWRMYEERGALRHARDADRHAILFLKKAKVKKEFRALAWPHLYGPRGAYR